MIHSLAYMITVLRNEFSNYCNGKLAQIGLTQGLLVFIVYIGKVQCCSAKQLTNDLRMDAGYTTRILAKLEKEGFIKQDIHPNDRRSRILSLTSKGEDAFALSHDLFYEWDQKITKNLSTTQHEDLLVLLKGLIQEQGGEIQ